MDILKPNTGEERVPICVLDFYIMVMDYGEIKFLKDVKIGPGQHSWEWLSFKPDKTLDISNINGNYCTFDNAINRAVNDMYCTVYNFKNFQELIKNWENIKYVSSINTVYKSEVIVNCK
jgi:hypothetical protein